ncbi:MAG TPA: hypothetical protein VJZ76_04150, partial [Thermoanaerobaculia bacterium]|nr:hypothetical protein [Thermoanaerobaculia bacterium]
MTYTDQAALVAPTASGQTGLFNVVTGNTLHRGDLSFGIYVNGYPLEAAESPIVIPSARENRPIDYYLTRLSASIGYGLSDRWEVSAMLPYDRIHNRGDDRTGFINGFHYAGRFSESGTGPIRLATKFQLTPADGPNHFAISLFADLPTGDHDSGISTGGTDWGAGAHYTTGQWTVGGSYKIRGSRSADDSNFPAFAPVSVDIPNEWTLEAGLNHPLGFWRTTNWITEATGVFYQGGDFKPDNPIYLVTGLRHWFGDSGWALSAGVRWNVAKFGRNSEECRVTELEDCSLAGLAGLTFAPLHLAAVA